MTEKDTSVEVGGSIDRALKGDYRINVIEIIKEAWQQTLLARLSINVGLLFCIFLSMAILLVAGHYMGGVESVLQDEASTWMVNILITLVVYPFLAGVEMMGIYHSVKVKTHSRLVFSFLHRASFVAICALLCASLTAIGSMLFLIPGIYLMVALSLALPLVIEKKLSPIQSVTLSIKATRFQWFNMFLLHVFVLACLLLCTIPLILTAQGAFGIVGSVLFLVGFSYVAPLFYNIKGILYREIFGLTLHAVNGKNVNVKSTFSA